MAVGALLAVFGFLHGGTAAVGAGDVLLFLGFGLYLARVGAAALAASPKRDAIFKDFLKIVVHLEKLKNYNIKKLKNEKIKESPPFPLLFQGLLTFLSPLTTYLLTEAS